MRSSRPSRDSKTGPFRNAAPSVIWQASGYVYIGARESEDAGVGAEQELEDRAVVVENDRAQSVRDAGEEKVEEVRLVHVNRQ